MCRGFQQNERDSLKIRGFNLRLVVSNAFTSLPDSLTLHYLPRINGSPFDINDTRIQPDSPVFVTLHRLVSPQAMTQGAIFASRERVKASGGVRFEVYLGDEKLLKGTFRRVDEDDEEWKLECKCVLESEQVGVEVTEAEVRVAVEGQATMSQRVETVVKRKRKTKSFKGLEEIPEEREREREGECKCCCTGGEDVGRGTEGGDNWGEEMMEMEGVKWAVDLGVWVFCFGVGYLVTRASSKSLRRTRLL